MVGTAIDSPAAVTTTAGVTIVPRVREVARGTTGGRSRRNREGFSRAHLSPQHA